MYIYIMKKLHVYNMDEEDLGADRAARAEGRHGRQLLARGLLHVERLVVVHLCASKEGSY